MNPVEVHQKVKERFGEAIESFNEKALDPYVVVKPEAIVEVCRFLKEDSALAFDCLSNMSGVDYLKENKIQVVLHLYSYPHRHKIVVKVDVPRENPIIPVYDIKGNFAGSAPKGLNNPRNPVSLMANTINDRGLAGRLFGNVYGEVDLIKGLTFRTSYGGEYYYGWSHTFNTPDFYNAEPQFTLPGYKEDSYNGTDWTWTNTFSYGLVKG